MILRLDRWGIELPPPSDPDPNGAAAVQELLTGSSPTSNGDGSIEGAMSDVKSARNTQQFIAGGHAALP